MNSTILKFYWGKKTCILCLLELQSFTWQEVEFIVILGKTSASFACQPLLGLRPCSPTLFKGKISYAKFLSSASDRCQCTLTSVTCWPRLDLRAHSAYLPHKKGRETNSFLLIQMSSTFNRHIPQQFWLKQFKIPGKQSICIYTWHHKHLQKPVTLE